MKSTFYLSDNDHVLVDMCRSVTTKIYTQISEPTTMFFSINYYFQLSSSDTITFLPSTQIIGTKTLVPPLRELKRLIRCRVSEMRDVTGVDLAALKLIAKAAHDRRRDKSFGAASSETDIWAGLGLGSDVAAALEGKTRRPRK